MARSLRRTLVAGSVGNVLEWYDFALYGYFAPVIAKLFFPEAHGLGALLPTFGVFAVGFLARPLGAALWGHVGDTAGRKTALVWSVVLMALPTFLFGLLPTYERIGIAAPLLLVVLRLVQGLSVGGEFTASIAFLVEHAPAGRRGYAGSWSESSAQVGILLGSAVSALLVSTLSEEALHAWGWRVPFLFGLLVGLVGLRLRIGIEETPAFREASGAGSLPRSPLGEILAHRRAELARAAGLLLLYAVSFYLAFVYLITYRASVLRDPLGPAMTSNTIGLATYTLLVPLIGAWSDRVGRRLPMALGAAGLAILSVPLFYVLGEAALPVMLAVQLVFAVLIAAYAGPLSVALVDLFPLEGRCTGLSVAYNLVLAIFGGTAPLVATWLIERSGSRLAPGLYLAVCAAVSLAAVAFAVRSPSARS